MSEIIIQLSKVMQPSEIAKYLGIDRQSVIYFFRKNNIKSVHGKGNKKPLEQWQKMYINRVSMTLSIRKISKTINRSSECVTEYINKKGIPYLFKKNGTRKRDKTDISLPLLSGCMGWGDLNAISAMIEAGMTVDYISEKMLFSKEHIYHAIELNKIRKVDKAAIDQKIKDIIRNFKKQTQWQQ